jgi:nitrogen fixation protein FixH
MSMVSKTRELTDGHMLAIMMSFFAIVIVVNLTMAFLARSSWTGIVAGKYSCHSREFREKAAEARARAALGWTSEYVIAGGEVSYRLTDRAGSGRETGDGKFPPPGL